MTILSRRVFSFGIFIGFCGFAALSSGAASSQVWPFDQRQIALVKKADKTYPSDQTVALVLDVFAKRGRVRWVTQKAGRGQVAPLEVPGDFLWHSAQAIRNFGLKLKVDGILALSQKGVQIDLSWFSTVDGQPLFYETLSIPDSNGSAEQDQIRRTRIIQWVEDIWGRIPGAGYVVKRDLKTLTLEGAPQVGLKIGDMVRMKRLEKIERHSLLKTVIGMSASVTGIGKVVAIDGQLATVEIDYESQIDPIESGDRYEIALPAEKSKSSALVPNSSNEAELKMIDQDDGRKFVPLFGQPPSGAGSPSGEAVKEDEPKYKILDVAALFSYGKVTHSDTLSTSVTAKSMTAWTPGFRLNLKAYVTKEYLFLTDVDFSYVKFSDQTANYGTDVIASGLSSFRLAGAYRYIYLPDENQPGEIDFHFGLRRFGLAMGSTAAADSPLAKAYSGWDIGANVMVPIVPRYLGFFKISKILWTSLTETPHTSGASSENNVWQFEVGAKYKYNPTTELIAGIGFDSATTSYTGTGTRSTESTAFELSSTLYQVGGVFKY